MAKDIIQQAGGKADSTIISLPESVKKSLPSDFDIGAIGKIDLREAESIANEDILLIKESELIEGLDNFDIIPIEEDGKASSADLSRVDDRKIALTAEIERIVDRIIKHGRKTEEAPAEEDEKTEYEEETAPVIEIKKKDELEYDDGRTWISLEELEKYDEHGHKWTPLEELLLEGGKDDREAGRREEKKDGRPSGEAAAEKTEGIRSEKPLMVEGYIESDDEYVIWDMPPEKRVEKVQATAKPVSLGKTAPSTDGEQKKTNEIHEKDTVTKEDEVVISMEDLDGPVKVEKKNAEELAPVEFTDTLKQTEPGVDVIGKPERLSEDRQSQQYRDLVLSGMIGDSREIGEVYFIDDATNGKEREEKSIFDESDLDKIISGIVQVDEGSAYMLGEANVEEDRERIAVIAGELMQAHEDLFVDLDYKYGDEELDYIHAAIVEEDYAGYIREIDEFFGIPGGRTIPAAVELLGLTADEFDTIEDTLFQDEFKDIHLYDRYHLYEFDRASRAGGGRDRKNCRYLLPEENSLMDDERDSIESDVSSASALIFEEDIQDITEQLIKRTGKTEAEIRDLVEKTFGIESLIEGPGEATGVAAVHEEEGPSAAEGITDITDRVVILDNEADVDRFVKEFPEGKQMNIKMLLKYLDGLFETLPEEIIKKFASSEYFELYLKVLNELGV
ncbi:MAG TPA: hypothetical protein PLM53_12415 [Spirochaetota bacterium]|nr:hypothetical protein [Spirochaetota bacterium]HPC42788.1 hypothetical protein [Spirochaetota bacterium]HPL15975.1 hypothetical protein [Spirochaetota bacterium]HQF09009.1 hypothetical protein [Spirochaetota bacterium]HQH97897.1 hypothetical protein [Spirochaetota bacterium]